jgi:hypothetical protein
MAIYSQDSKYIIGLDVPEVKDLKVKFVYNFFTRDERLNSKGIIENNEKYDLKSIPRYNEIFFTSPELFTFEDEKQISNNLDFSNFATPTFIRTLINDLISTEPLIKYINFEDSTSTPSDISFSVVDSNVASRISNKINFLYDIYDTNVRKNDFLNDILSNYSNLNSSRLIRVSEVLFRQNRRSKIIDETNNKIDLIDPFDNIKNKKITCILDTKNLSKVMASNSSRTDESTIDLKEIARSINNSLSNLINPNDLAHSYPSFKILHLEQTNNTNPNKNWGAKVVGYVITKSTKNELGEDVGIEHFFYPKADKNVTYIDDKVVYGYSYNYSVKTVVLVKHLVFDNGTPSIAYSLIGSSDSLSVTRAAVDNVPPTNFNYVYYEYDYADEGLKINWQLPTSKKKSVKYVQVFRRLNILEPFELIAEFDFDDSIIRSSRKEMINADKSIKTSRDPISKVARVPVQFIDRNFNKDSKYIYSLALLDAHHLTSGYSQQIQVSFDRHKNKLNLKTISEAGAPKQYPNFYIDPTLDDNVYVRSFTVDAMKISNYKRINIYLDPDALSYDSYKRITEKITFDNVKDKEKNSKYLFQMINLDRQLDDTVTIEINKINQRAPDAISTTFSTGVLRL